MSLHYTQSTGYSYFAFRQDPRYRVITTTSELDDFAAFLRSAKTVAYDYETNGLAWWRGRNPCGVAFAAVAPGELAPKACYIPFRHITGQAQLPPEKVIAFQREFLEDPKYEKVAHNIKFEEHMSRQDGLRILGPRVCTQVEARLYDENRLAGLKVRMAEDLGAQEGLRHESMLSQDVHRLAKRRGLGIEAYKDEFGYAELDVYLCGAYAARDAAGCLLLHQHYENSGVRSYYSRSPRGPQYRSIYDTEMALTHVLCKMEELGQPLDVEYLRALDAMLTEERTRAEVDFFTHFGCEYFNLGSDDQLRDFLQKGLKLRWEQTTKNGQPSVDFDVISDLCEKVPALSHVLRYKDVEKKLSTYTVKLIERADDLGILHCDYQQSGTTSGRLSCKNPNLHNVSSDDPGRAKAFWAAISKENWKEALRDAKDKTEAQKRVAFLVGHGKDPESIKRAFVVQRHPDDPYRKHLEIKFGGKVRTVRQYWDYSQIELRVLAEYTRDTGLVRAYAENKDIHDEVEKAVFGTGTTYVDGKKVDGPNRRKAKCFHPETEVLTRSGWKRILSLLPGEEVVQAIPSDGFEVQLEWVVPDEVFSKPNHDPHLVHLYNEGMDIRVTPDHRMAAWGSPNGKKEPFRVVMPHEMPKQRGWMNAGRMAAGDWEVDEALLRLAVAVQADGSLRPAQAVTFGFSKQRKKDRLRQLLGDRKYTESTKGAVTTFYVPNCEDIRSLLNEDKEFKWDWLSLTPSLRDVVLDEVQHWDSCVRPNWRMVRYSSTSTQSIDVIQALAAISNRKTRCVYSNSSSIWNLTIRDKPSTRGGSLEVNHIQYHKEVACLSVPSSFVLVRDGKAKVPVVVGQTINFGLSYCMSPIGFTRQIREVTEQEAQHYFDEYNRRFPGVPRFREAFWSYVRTNRCQFDSKFGRTRHVPTIVSGSYGERKRAERESIAALIQGTAADFTKLSLVLLDEWLEAEGLYTRLSQTIHDEIQEDGPVEEFAMVAKKTKEIMTYFPDFVVPIQVDGSFSIESWINKSGIPGV